MIELGTQSASSPTTEITGTVTFEFVGFDTDDDSITVTVTDPNGDTMAAQLDGAIWEATALPGFPPGPYAFSARQTSAQGASEAPEATGSFSVVPATKPRAVALDPFLRPGSTFHIALAGFPSDAGFFLYGPKDDQNLQLLRPLAPPSLSDGAAIYPVPTEPDDQPGLYGVWSAPCGAVHACATFSVSA